MMSTTAKNPDTTPIPVQLSADEFNACILPHLSMPKRGPKCKIGYHRVFNLILWVLYTGMQWKCLPIPKDPHGKPDIHYTNVYRAFAKWADDDSLQKAFMASVGHLSEEKQLDVRANLANTFWTHMRTEADSLEAGLTSAKRSTCCRDTRSPAGRRGDVGR